MASEDKKPEAGESVAAIVAANVIVPFKRRFVLPGLVIGALELLAIALPLWTTFDLGDLGADTLFRTLLPVAVGAVVVWLGAMAAWFAPLWQAVALRRRGERVPKDLAARAYRITLKGPVRVLLLRTMVWTTAAAMTGLFLHVYDAWPVDRVAAMIAVAGVHSYVVSCVRARVGRRRSSPRSARGYSRSARRSRSSTTVTSGASCWSR